MLVRIFQKITLIKILRRYLVWLDGKVSNFLHFLASWNDSSSGWLCKVSLPWYWPVLKPFVYVIHNPKNRIHRMRKGVMFLVIRYVVDVLFFGLWVMLFNFCFMVLWFCYVATCSRGVWNCWNSRESGMILWFLNSLNWSFGYVSSIFLNILMASWRLRS